MSVQASTQHERYSYELKRRMSFEDWLTQPGVQEGPLPDGFVESGFAYQYWDHQSSLGWAILNWNKSIEKERWFQTH
jgi:hypothetical protein